MGTEAPVLRTRTLGTNLPARDRPTDRPTDREKSGGSSFCSAQRAPFRFCGSLLPFASTSDALMSSQTAMGSQINTPSPSALLKPLKSVKDVVAGTCGGIV